MQEAAHFLPQKVKNNLDFWLTQSFDLKEDKPTMPATCHLIVSCSGGKDSSALLHVLVALKLPQINLSVLHVNHHLRGSESDADQKFVEELALQYQLPIQVYDGSLQPVTDSAAAIKGGNVQNKARQIRQKYSQKNIRRWQKHYQQLGLHPQIWLATAHHLEDQIENFFLKLLRGTSLTGLVGQALWNQQLKRVCPFDGVSGEQIGAYIKAQNIAHREDSSNLQSKYRRNHLRLQLIPFLKTHYQAQLSPVMADNLSALRQDDELLNELAQTRWQNILRPEVRHNPKEPEDLQWQIERQLWQKIVPNALVRRVFVLWFELVQINSNRLKRDTWEQIQKVWPHAKWRVQLNSDWYLEADACYLTLQKKRAALSNVRQKVSSALLKQCAWELPLSQLLDPLKNHLNSSNQWTFLQKNHTPYFSLTVTYDLRFLIPEREELRRLAMEGWVFLDLQKVKSVPNLLLRTRQVGDYWQPLGLKGHKSIKKFLIDQKVPRRLREQLWLLACGPEVVALWGHGISQRWALDQQTECAIGLKLKFELIN